MGLPAWLLSREQIEALDAPLSVFCLGFDLILNKPLNLHRLLAQR